jgi:hypothetical protein
VKSNVVRQDEDPHRLMRRALLFLENEIEMKLLRREGIRLS